MSYQIPKPLRNNIGFLLRVASERATEHLDQQLEIYGLHSRHAAVLALAEEQAFNQNTIAAATQTHPNALIALIDALEEKQLAVREQNPLNRREYLVKVTPAGRRLVRQMKKAFGLSTEKFMENLNSEEKGEFTRLLLKCIEAWAG